ncbi:hypothetical protein SAMN02982917_5510 [Azospirillum oryzae]|uniref:Uncharacterized protein n=1 Tax=Azospirillum oryzae TaxID=286727 RepID=A0A1X7HBG4_9PROT|nr:hypothetical protein [Azospirillum oryzae]SMF83327.1 hypothetical protein SAMN02982917_5510 [Azospirillum oryzae]
MTSFPLPPGFALDDIVALTLIAAEMARVRTAEQRPADGDAVYTDGDLAAAGGVYLLNAGASDLVRADYPPGKPCDLWPWANDQWKPKSPIRDAVRGCALGAFEISRRLRAGEPVEG